MTLSDKMKRLAEIDAKIKELTAHLLDEQAELKQEVESEVLELGQSIQVGNVTAKYSKGRGRYDYDAAFNDVMSGVEEMEDIDAANMLKDKYTKTTTEFDAKAWVIEWVGEKSAKSIFEEHYKAGKPSVSVVIE